MCLTPSAYLVLLVACGSGMPADLEELEGEIRARYPDVEAVSVEWLASRLDAPPEERPVLIDVRAPEEYAVSRIPGAVNIPLGELDADSLAQAGVTRDREVVFYCSVGYRSSEAARRAREAGFENTANLIGSIFAWANAGRPLVDEDGPAREVHPYDESWGRYLEESRRAPLK